MKSNLSILVFLFIAQFAFAQLHVGVKLGANLTTFAQENPLADSYFENLKVSPNALTGLTAKYTFSRHFFILGDLIYAGKGTKGTFHIKEYKRYNLHYLEASLSPAFKVNRYFNVEGGIYYGHLLGAFAKWHSGILRNVTNEFNRPDYGVQAGLSFEIEGFNLGIRYQRGLKTWRNGIGPEQQNRGLQVWVSYLYPCFKGRY